MDLLLGLAAMMILPGAIVAAFLGWQGLSAHSLDTWRLKMAAWMIAVPWIAVLASGGMSQAIVLLSPSSMGGIMLASPAVALTLLAWWSWRRYQLRTTVPATITTVRRHARQAWNEPAFRPTASFADLRLPKPFATAIAVVIVSLWAMWIASSRPSSEWDFGKELFEIAAAFGTLLISILAILCALAFAARRAPLMAAMYSAMALCVLLGHVTLAILGYWEAAAKESVLHYAYEGVLAIAGMAAIAPALASHAWDLARRRVEITDDLYDWYRRWGG